MAKKPRRKKDEDKRFSERMERVGRKFGKRMGKQGRDFGEEVEELGEKLGAHIEERRERRERRKFWHYGIFGLIFPLIWSVFTLVFLAIGIWLLNFINLSLRSYFIFQVSSFLFSNLYIFFSFSLFFGYAHYLHRRSPEVYWIFSPVANSMGIAFVVWIAIFIFDLINVYAGSIFIQSLAGFLRVNFIGIFFLFLVLGYVFVIIRRILCL